MSFLIDNHKTYSQLVDDLSIIDNVYDIFEEDYESEFNDKQVLDTARLVAYKQHIINQTIQSEIFYVNKLEEFNTNYVGLLRSWLSLPEDKELKLKLIVKKTLETLFQSLQALLVLHKDFLKKVSDRFRIWGPTQLISDIFIDFYKYVGIYDTFFTQHPEFVLTLDVLHRFNSLIKYLEMHDKKPPFVKLREMSQFIQIPINKINNYSKILEQLKNYSDGSHPDYAFLYKISKNFATLDNEWSERKKNCQSHLMVLEIYQSIQDCPVTVTLNRRLVLQSELIKVDLEDVAATSDMRTYYLYSDHLIFCRKQKDKKDGLRRLVFKGSLNLRGADIRELQPALISKMCETKKPLFKIGKKSSETTSLASTNIFGFELITLEAIVDAPIYFSNASMPPQISSSPVRRRHVIRTRSQEEQNVWYTTITNVIKAINRPSQKK